MYVFKFIVMAVFILVGRIISPSFTSSHTAQWVIGLGFGAVGAFLGKFIHYYAFLSPKTMLAKECENTDLVEKHSVKELTAFIHMLHKKGFISILPDTKQQVFVDEKQWYALSELERVKFAAITLRVFELNGGVDLLTIGSSDGKEIALYSKASGLSDSRVRHDFSMDEVAEAAKAMGFTKEEPEPVLHTSIKEQVLKGGDDNWSLDEFKTWSVLLQKGSGPFIGGISSNGKPIVKDPVDEDFDIATGLKQDDFLRFTPDEAMKVVNSLNHKMNDPEFSKDFPDDVKWAWQDMDSTSDWDWS